jgi:integrating conjugative element relaxase (TIGR03760 family)
MDVDFTNGALIATIGCSLALLAWNRHTLSRAEKTPLAPAQPQASPPSYPPGFLPVLPAVDLYREVRVEPLLFRIRQALGFAPENYDRDVQPLQDAVAEFVQLLPASESHHHANPGGLLTHVLEVAAVALLRSEEAKLPIGRPTEEQLKFAARWRYGILVAALLHDIGKPIADVEVTVRRPNGSLGPWNGLGGRLADVGDCYRVQFPLRHDYGAHQRLPVMLLKTMVPASTMRWLADDVELVNTLIAYLSGESDGGPIGQLVKTADGKSVADNLLQGDRTRFATARQVPLIERMMAALRRMLAEGELPLNREGAPGFCDGADAWFVAGTLADKVRTYLDTHEVRENGAAALPTDNSRLFDTWLDYGAVRANDAGGAIWKAQVTLDKGEGRNWSQTFTMLRFPLDKLYVTQDGWPQALNGKIELAPANAPVTAPPAVQQTAGGATANPVPQEPTESTTQTSAPASNQVDAGAADMDFGLTPIALDETPTSLAPLSPQIAALEEEFLDNTDMATPTMLPDPVQAAPTGPVIPAAPTAPVAPAQPGIPKNSVSDEMRQPDPDIERLMGWIQQGINKGDMPYNRASATVHFVKEGMFLISPKIFREFLQASGVVSEGDASPSKRLQKLLQKSGYVAKAKPNSFLHTYRITNAKNPDRSLVTGYLVPNPGDFFAPIPEANVHLESIGGDSGEPF